MGVYQLALGLPFSHALWGWTLASGIWQPTFVAFVSLPAAMARFLVRAGGDDHGGATGGTTGNTGQPADGQLPVLSPAVARGSGQCEWHGEKRRAFIPVRFPSWVRQCGEPTVVAPVVNQPDYGVVWTLRRVLPTSAKPHSLVMSWPASGYCWVCCCDVPVEPRLHCHTVLCW